MSGEGLGFLPYFHGVLGDASGLREHFSDQDNLEHLRLALAVLRQVPEVCKEFQGNLDWNRAPRDTKEWATRSAEIIEKLLNPEISDESLLQITYAVERSELFVEMAYVLAGDKSQEHGFIYAIKCFLLWVQLPVGC